MVRLIHVCKRTLFLDVPHERNRIVTKLVQEHLLLHLVVRQCNCPHLLPNSLGDFSP